MVNSWEKNESLGDLGEARILSRLAEYGGWNTRVTCGIGDDCAICRTEDPKLDQVFTSDARLREFIFESVKIQFVGRKAVSRVLSDLASMGGKSGVDFD